MVNMCLQIVHQYTKHFFFDRKGQPISNNGIAGFPTMANFKKMEKLISLNSMAGAFGKTLDNSDDNPTEPKSPSTDPAKPEALYAKKYSFGNVKILKSNWRGDSSKLPRFIIEDPDNVVELGTTPWQIGCKLIVSHSVLLIIMIMS